MAELIGRSRKAGLVPQIYEVHGDIETPKWMVMDMFFHGSANTPYYWLVTIDDEHVTSFASVASSDDEWPKCLTARFTKLPGLDRIAHPEDVRRHIKRNPDILSYSSRRKNHKTAKWWSSISKSCHQELYAKLELGKLYRAIDVTSMVPIFRMKDRLIGLAIK